MKKLQKLFRGFTVVAITVIFTMIGCASMSEAFKTKTFPSDFIGKWERVTPSPYSSYTLSIYDSDIYASNQDSGWFIAYMFDDKYELAYIKDQGRKKTLRLKLDGDNMEIIDGDGLGGWSGTYRSMSPRNTPTVAAQTQTQVQAQLVSTTPDPVKDDDFEIMQNRDNTITITGFKGTAKNLVIPDTLYGLKVTVIRNRAFQEKGLVSVVIPDTVITIEDGLVEWSGSLSYTWGAFYNNKDLIKVTLGKGLKTIGNRAFSDCHITEITIPDSVTRIGDSSFFYAGLTKVTFGTGLQNIGSSAFANPEVEDYPLKANRFTEVILPSSLKEIGDRAFQYNRIQTLALGSGIQTIGQRAFYSNKIQKLTLGSGLQVIGEEAFRNNQINELNFTLPSSLKTIANGTFANNQIQSVTIPNSITGLYSAYTWGKDTLYNGAFANNPLTTVVIPAPLANGRIDDQSFGSRNGNTITRITIPAGMREDTLSGLFEQAFVNFWINQNRAGGTYVKRGPIWTKE